MQQGRHKAYSTSFSLATKMLDSSIRKDIYNIYGFVRFADEIVDSFHCKEDLFNRFEEALDLAINDRISLTLFSMLFNTPITSMPLTAHLSKRLCDQCAGIYINLLI